MKHFLLVTLLLITMGSVAQEKWNITLRPALHFPTSDALQQSLRIGNGIQLTAGHRLGNRTSIYVGPLWNRFDSDEGFLEEDIEFIQRGFILGGRHHFSILKDQKNPFYINAGITFTDVKTRSTNPFSDIDTAWSVGTQLGIGMKITSLENWYILPEIRYGYTSNQYQRNGKNVNLSLSSISISAGIMRIF